MLQFSMTCECFVLIILSESKQIIDKWLEEKHQSCPNSPKLYIKTVEHFWNKIKNIYKKKYLEMIKIWILKFKIFIITIFNFFSKNTTILHKIPYFLRKNLNAEQQKPTFLNLKLPTLIVCLFGNRKLFPKRTSLNKKNIIFVFKIHTEGK